MCLACFYIEGLQYQENILPKIHKLLGYEVKIVTSQYTFDAQGKESLREVGQYINADGIEVNILPYRKGKFAKKYRLYLGLENQLLQYLPDIVFCHGPQFFDIKIIKKYVKNHKNAKLFIDNHSDYINTNITGWKRRIFHMLVWGHCARSVQNETEVFWGVTPLRVQYLQDIYKIESKKTNLLVMGGDGQFIDWENRDKIKKHYRSKWGIPEDAFLVVTGGKIDQKKNIHLLLEAATKLNIYVLVFGSLKDEIKDDINKYRSEENVRIIGWIESREAYNYFLAADMAVFPGTHSVLWEQAAACGIPMVCKYWQGMDHIDIGGNCHFLYLDSSDEIRECLLNILENIQVYSKMKEVAVENGRKYFSYYEIGKRSIDKPCGIEAKRSN